MKPVSQYDYCFYFLNDQAEVVYQNTKSITKNQMRRQFIKQGFDIPAAQVLVAALLPQAVLRIPRLWPIAIFTTISYLGYVSVRKAAAVIKNGVLFENVPTTFTITKDGDEGIITRFAPKVNDILIDSFFDLEGRGKISCK